MAHFILAHVTLSLPEHVHVASVLVIRLTWHFLVGKPARPHPAAPLSSWGRPTRVMAVTATCNDTRREKLSGQWAGGTHC